MSARFTSLVLVSMLFAATAGAATNLDSSKSNVYRLTYPGDRDHRQVQQVRQLRVRVEHGMRRLAARGRRTLR